MTAYGRTDSRLVPRALPLRVDVLDGDRGRYLRNWTDDGAGRPLGSI